MAERKQTATAYFMPLDPERLPGLGVAPVPTSDSDTEPTPGGSVSYGVLTQKHDEYDAELIERIEDLYVGGFEIQKRAKKHLCQLEGESHTKFAERCRIATYIAFFSQIVDQFTSDVFVQPISVKPAADAKDPNTPGEYPSGDFYPEFEKNADRRGTSFRDLMMTTLRTGLKHRRALVVVDAPDTGAQAPAPVNLAEEEARGARRCYAYECPVGRLINWKIDDATGRFVWALLFDREQIQDGPLSARVRVRETFTVWTIDALPDATAKWSRYVHEYKQEEPPKADTLVRFDDEGSTSFRRIPILRFELAYGLWVGNKVGPQALEHWQRRSALIGAQNRSLVAVPYVKRGPQAMESGGPIPADIAEDQNRGERPVAAFNSKGWLELAAGDEFGFGEPEGKCYELIDAQLEKLRAMMFQVTFQMAASIERNNTSMGRSGLSKEKDEDITARVLRALGHTVRTFAVEVFDTVSAARGDDVHWTPHGLDGYDGEDRQSLIQEALGLDQVANAIPSETFHVAHARAIAEKLLRGAVDVETMAIILNELADGIKVKHQIAKLMSDTTKDRLTNPAPVGAPGSMAPGTRVPGRPAVNGGSPKGGDKTTQ